MRLVTRRRIRRRLGWMAHPALYAAQSDRPDLADDPRGTVTHYLAVGAQRGLRVSALFHPQWYADRLAEHGAAVPAGVTPLLHFLDEGWERRIVPTPLFDEVFYAQRHPELAKHRGWLFEHYLTLGCYQPRWEPSPVGRHHSGGDGARSPRMRQPLLMRQLLHHADEFDLSRTSWLEEGVIAALAAYDGLATPRMRELIDHAAALEPLIAATPERRPVVFCPPHRGPRVHLASVAEDVRRRVGRDRAAVVVLVPGSEATRIDLGGADGEGVLVIGTDHPSTAPTPAQGFLDLADDLAAFDPPRRVDLLLDVVRGLAPERIVCSGSAAGAELLDLYGRQLAAGSTVERR